MKQPEAASLANHSGFGAGRSSTGSVPAPTRGSPPPAAVPPPGSARSAGLTVGAACHEGASAARAEPRTKRMAWTQPGRAVCVRAGARGRVSLAHACPGHQCLGSGPGRRLLKASQGESQFVTEPLTAWWKEVIHKRARSADVPGRPDMRLHLDAERGRSAHRLSLG